MSDFKAHNENDPLNRTLLNETGLELGNRWTSRTVTRSRSIFPGLFSRMACCWQ